MVNIEKATKIMMPGMTWAKISNVNLIKLFIKIQIFVKQELVQDALIYNYFYIRSQTNKNSLRYQFQWQDVH